MTVELVQSAIFYRLLLLIPVAVAAGMIPLIRAMRKLALRPQFMVLLVLGLDLLYFFDYGANV
jgi:hypothetical protein